MPVYINIEKYTAAQRVLVERRWQGDVEAGLLYGVRGRPFTARLNGYIYGTLPGAQVPVQVFAHRVLWEWANGPLGELEEINHRNLVRHDNRASNLEVVTRLGNVRHAVDAGAVLPRQGEAHGMARLTELDVLAIRLSTERDAVLGRRYGVSERHMKAVRGGGSWKHVDVKAERRRPGIPRLDMMRAEEMRALAGTGVTQRSLAVTFGVSEATVSGVVRGTKWRA
jgi:hypothetical protein